MTVSRGGVKKRLLVTFGIERFCWQPLGLEQNLKNQISVQSPNSIESDE
jgi:hypothetical protein